GAKPSSPESVAFQYISSGAPVSSSLTRNFISASLGICSPSGLIYPPKVGLSLFEKRRRALDHLGGLHEEAGKLEPVRDLRVGHVGYEVDLELRNPERLPALLEEALAPRIHLFVELVLWDDFVDPAHIHRFLCRVAVT